MLQIARKQGFELKFFNYRNPNIKDVGEMSEEDINFGLENAKDMIFGEKAFFV